MKSLPPNIRAGPRALRFRCGRIRSKPEHIHLLISEPDRGTQSTVMQVLKQRFARRVLTERRKRQNPEQSALWKGALESSPVWQARFYDFVVRTEIKKREKLKYIHRNPVRRGLA